MSLKNNRLVEIYIIYIFKYARYAFNVIITFVEIYFYQYLERKKIITLIILF